LSKRKYVSNGKIPFKFIGFMDPITYVIKTSNIEVDIK